MTARGIFAALSVFFMATAAPAPAAAAPVPGVTDTEVTFGITGPLSGPAAAWGSIALAAEAYAKYVNDQGGVHGRKIKLILKDDGYNPGKAVANVTEMKDNVFAVIGTVGTAVLNATKDVIADSGTPLIAPLANVQVWAKQPKIRRAAVFQIYPDYADEGEWLVVQANKVEGVKKIAVFGQNDDYGREALAGVKRGVAKVKDVSIVSEVFVEVTDRELGTHALKIKDSGAEAVLLYSTPTQAAALVKEMAKVGYRPKIFASFTLYDRDTMFRLVGDLWDGAYFNTIIAVRGEPAADRDIDIITRIEPKLKGREGFCVTGASNIKLVVEGLKGAGRDLTREKFLKAIESLRGYTAGGLLPPTDFGPDRHHGGNQVRMMRAGTSKDSSAKQVVAFEQFPPHF